MAEEARRMADAASSPFEMADFLAIEQRWLSLARSMQLWPAGHAAKPPYLRDYELKHWGMASLLEGPPGASG